MRGFFSFLTTERDWGEYKSCVFVASSDPDITIFAMASVREHVPRLSLTFVAPRSYGEMFPPELEFIAFEAIKEHPFQSVVRLRARQFDVCVVLLPGRPSFAKAKLAAFFLNTRRTLVFNEFHDLVPLDASHATYLPRHLALRFWRKLKKFLVPFGLPYLFYRTVKLKMRAR